MSVVGMLVKSSAISLQWRAGYFIGVMCDIRRPYISVTHVLIIVSRREAL